MSKIRVLVVPSDNGGCGYYRSLRPHTKLSEMFEDDFDVVINYDVNWKDIEYISKFDIIHFHKGLFNNVEDFRAAMDYCKENDIVRIMDIDDFWDVGPYHPNYHFAKRMGIEKIIKDNFKYADYVTTTTPIFAKEIKKFNPNVKVIVNAIDPEEDQFIPKTNPSDRIRFGFIMGSSHKHDMEMLRGVTNKLPKDVIDKIQFVLCGYDLRGSMSYQDKDGLMKTRPIQPQESVWYDYEKIVTDDYKIVSPQYKAWLNTFTPNVNHPNENNEPYKRRWTKDIMNYCTHYNDIDVLLVPLAETQFNSVKSELKLIEAGMMGKAAVVSNFGPYTLGTVNFFEKGGKVNPEGNCVLIDKVKAHKDWAKTIEKLVKNPEYIEALSKNLHEHIKDKYDLRNVTKERAEWYKEIVKRG